MFACVCAQSLKDYKTVLLCRTTVLAHIVQYNDIPGHIYLLHCILQS